MSPASRAETAPADVGGEAGVERTGLVVGIGASAGGLDAFKAFFSKMPPDPGMAFVLVQHLDPDYESALVAIVRGYTPMSVHIAEDGAVLRPNHVYVTPPDSLLAVKGGILRVTRPALPAARRTSITSFLASLAEDQGENAVGIILSGFGSDGTLGIAAIKEYGGLTLSQAEFDHQAKSGMPQSAASGGFVDHVLSVEEMPAALLDYQRYRTIGNGSKGPDGIHQDLPNYLPTIFAVLNSRLGRDFSQYKSGTLMRRIQRRMYVLRVDSVPAYIEQLRSLPDEAELLLRELLISVTRFFRDHDAFDALEARILPPLFTDRRGNDPIRVWVAGCATGEEAYSVAILLKEGLGRSERRRPVQVFATDVDDRAIEVARAGLYAGTIAADISAERLEANFVREDGRYRVTRELREMCLFSAHDLVKDPPFSRLDLVCCRNVLIYFDQPLQQRAFSIFHYALRPERHLLLGPSESVPAQSHLFAPLDRRHRLYVRRDAAARLPTFSLSHAPERLPAARRTAHQSDEIDQRASRVIARYAPAYLVVDRQHDIVRFSGQTAKYIEPATGAAALNLFQLLHRDLRGPVRTALKHSADAGERVVHEAVIFEAGDQYEAVNLIVEPLPDAEDSGFFLVAFQEASSAFPPTRHAALSGSQHEEDAAVQALNRELIGTRERLRNVTEDLEATTADLQAANEEYLSVNEELQSANEELETSREELQSLNEELQTINAELTHRNESLVRSNSDLANLFDSTSIATLFLDNDLRIRRFTPRLLDIFKVREGDEGRPISDIVTRLTRDGLGKDVQQVLRTLTPLQREVTEAEGDMSYLMQIRPYRDTNNVVDGAVVTFVDITERRKHERARALLAAIVTSSQDAIISHDMDGTVTSWNAGAELLYGYSSSEAIGQHMSMLLDGSLADDWPHILDRLQGGEQIAPFESTRAAKDGRSLDVSVTISPITEKDQRIVGASVVARDVSERKAAEQKAAFLLGELDHRVKNILAIVTAVVSQTLKTSVTPEEFAAEVEGRVMAISKAHSLLTETGQGEVSLLALIATELAPYDRGNGDLVTGGSNIAFTPRAGLALAMAVHELASNAAKYGALSTASGRLSVTWTVAGSGADRRLTITWTETGGPAVQPPLRRGFGTTLIERALSQGLDADVNRAFLASGVRCIISMPLTEDNGRVQDAGEAGERGR